MAARWLDFSLPIKGFKPLQNWEVLLGTNPALFHITSLCFSWQRWDNSHTLHGISVTKNRPKRLQLRTNKSNIDSPFFFFFPLAGINTLNSHTGKVKLIQGFQCSLPKKPPARIYSVLNYSLEKFNRLLYKQRAKARQQWSQSDCAAPLCLPAPCPSQARMLNQFN